jgi:hypothetical protein
VFIFSRHEIKQIKDEVKKKANEVTNNAESGRSEQLDGKQLTSVPYTHLALKRHLQTMVFLRGPIRQKIR